MRAERGCLAFNPPAPSPSTVDGTLVTPRTRRHRHVEAARGDAGSAPDGPGSGAPVGLGQGPAGLLGEVLEGQRM